MPVMKRNTPGLREFGGWEAFHASAIRGGYVISPWEWGEICDGENSPARGYRLTPAQCILDRFGLILK